MQERKGECDYTADCDYTNSIYRAHRAGDMGAAHPRSQECSKPNLALVQRMECLFLQLGFETEVDLFLLVLVVLVVVIFLQPKKVQRGGSPRKTAAAVLRKKKAS